MGKEGAKWLDNFPIQVKAKKILYLTLVRLIFFLWGNKRNSVSSFQSQKNKTNLSNEKMEKFLQKKKVFPQLFGGIKKPFSVQRKLWQHIFAQH